MPDIESWLSQLRLEKYAPLFIEAEVDFETLPDLVEEDLKELGLPLGPRRKIWAAIQRLRQPSASPSPADDSRDNQITSGTADAERRQLTVMFVDLVGSTQMATRLDAEDMREVITRFQNTVAGVVGRFEGFVAKFMGDGVLCYFGWPRANEDDAERAVRAGLAIIEEVKKQSAPNPGGPTPLATRIGLATGVVIVGDLIGSGATQEAAVVGETPNLAARLQDLAEPNELVLPKDTVRLLGTGYRVRSIGPRELKGVEVPVEAFVVEGEISVESRFAARQMGALTPIVGREREIDLIRERWDLARSGQGQMLVISGEAGIGKSRITRALIDGINADDYLRIIYQCSPYHSDSAFYPVIQQMGFAAGFVEGDDVDTRLDKLESLLGKDRDTMKLIAAMMGLGGESRYGELGLTPAQQRMQTMLALARLLVQQTRDRPVLLLFEDLHWIDPTSLELLEIFLDAIADHKLMILATARPSFEYGFGGHPIVTPLALNRLGREQIDAIALKLTGGKTLPDEIMEIIASRTDGVPLFVEELTKTILESGVLEAVGDQLVLTGPINTISIPTTLHDSLMARLDRLQPIKEVAQSAACVGREFSHRILTKISSLSEADLGSALDGLINAELIYRRGVPPEATYRFRHALLRDAAYESLLKEKRRAVHARLLAALESDPDVPPEILAVHAEEAGLTEQAIDLWDAASKAALARPAFDEGISHLRHAIDLLRPQLTDSDAEKLNRALSLQIRLGVALMTRKGFGADESVAAFSQALEWADQLGETPLRYSILYGLWVSTGIRGQHANALRTGQALIEAAAQSDDTASQVMAHRVVGFSYWFMGDFEKSKQYIELAYRDFDPDLHKGLAGRFGQELGVSLHCLLSLHAVMVGASQNSQTHIDEAERVADTSGDVQSICYLKVLRSLVSYTNGDLEDARRCLVELKPIVQEHRLVLWLAYVTLFEELLAAGQGNKDSIARYKSADAAIIALHCCFFMPQLRVSAGWAALAMGLIEDARDLAAMAQELIDQTGEANSLAELLRLQAALAHHAGDIASAEKALRASLELSLQQGAKLWALRAAHDLATLLYQRGASTEAHALLSPVFQSIEEGDCLRDRAAAAALLAQCAQSPAQNQQVS